MVSFVPMPAVSEDGKIDCSDIRPYKEVRKGFTYFAENDVLFAKITPCMENGKGAVARGLENGIGSGSTEFHVLRPIAGKSNPYWLYIITMFDTFRVGARKVMTGTGGQLRVPIGYLNDYPISLPPIELQNSFEEFVHQSDKSKFISFKSQFIEMFGDPLSENSYYKKISILDACDNITGGGTPSKKHPEYYEGNIPWVSPKDMNTSIIEDSQDHITEEAITKSTTKLIPEQSVLMVIRSGVLKHDLPIAINKVPVTINQDMKAFLVGSKIIPQYLFGYFKTIEADVLRGVRAVTADNIEFKVFQERLIQIPPMGEQKKFAEFMIQTDKSK